MARILSDQGDFAGAFDAWADALRLDPMRTGALKGIAFLYFRAGDAAAAIEHLQRAAEVDPDDISIAQALARVRRGSRAMPSAPEPVEEEMPAPAPVPAAVSSRPPRQSAAAAQPQPVTAGSLPAMDEAGSAFAAIDGGRSVVLVDANGLLLAGSLTTPDGAENGDRVAAELAGVSREASTGRPAARAGAVAHASRSSRPDAHCVLVQPTADTMLLAAREPSLPMARVVLVAERAAREAKTWLERVQ